MAQCIFIGHMPENYYNNLLKLKINYDNFEVRDNFDVWRGVIFNVEK